jgi:exonuclease III
MKIVSWNCNGALRKKLSTLDVLNADVYVIQECEDPACSDSHEYRDWAHSFLWRGSNKNRGLGVFAKHDISLESVDLDSDNLELFLPCIVGRESKIALLAVWTKDANSSTFRYIGQLWKYLQAHKSFLSDRKSVLIGDLNSNSCWHVQGRWWNHSDVVKELQLVGLFSLYHHVWNEAQGNESTPTFFMHRKREKPYHIDYAFLSEHLLVNSSIEIGDPDLWLEYSDHMPMVVELMLNSSL